MFKSNHSYKWNNAELTKGSNSNQVVGLLPGLVAVDSVRAYKTHEGKLVTLDRWSHLFRFEQSAKLLGFKLPYSLAELEEGMRALLAMVPVSDHYISLAGDAGGVVMVAYPAPINPSVIDTRALVKASSPRGYPAQDLQIKSSLVYPTLPNNLHLDLQGYYSSASNANLFIVKNKVLLTPPNDGSIVPGVTRQHIYALFHESSFRTKLLTIGSPNLPLFFTEKKLTRSDLLLADEIFLTSTRDGITAVTEVEGQQIGNGKVGDFTTFLHSTFSKITRQLESYHAIPLERI